MTRLNFAGILLRLRLILTRSGTGALLASGLIVGAAALWFVLLPGITARVDEHLRAVAVARSAPPPKRVVSPQTLAAEHLAAFYAALGSAGHSEQVVTRLFDAASDAGVALDKGEYKPAHESAGRFDTYTIILPVKGDYARLRRFCEKVLATIPYAALEDMRFTRNSANDQAVEASLRFTVFLRAEGARSGLGLADVVASASAPALTGAVASAPASTLASASAPVLALASTSASVPKSHSPSQSQSASTSTSELKPPLPPSLANTAVVEVQR